MPEKYPEDRRHPRRLSSYQRGGEGRAELLWEVLVCILQVSLTEGPVRNLISAAFASGTQPVQLLDPPDAPENVETPGTSARVMFAGASAKTAGPSYRERQRRASWGTSAQRCTIRLQIICINGRCKRRVEPRGGVWKGGGGVMQQKIRRTAGRMSGGALTGHWRAMTAALAARPSPD